MKMKSFGMALSISVMFSGCMSTMQRPVLSKTTMPVCATKYKPSALNAPIGSVVLDDSSVVIRSTMTDSQTTTAFVMPVLFGVAGAIVTEGIMQLNTKNNIKNVDTLKKIYLPKITLETLQQMKRQKRLLPILQPVRQKINGRRYELNPFLYFEADDKGNRELLVLLRIVQYNQDNKNVWLGQYVKHINIKNAKLLHNEKQLNYKIRQALQKTISVFNQDLRGELKKDEKQKVSIKIKDSLTYGSGILWGWIVFENKQEVIFQTRATPDSVNGGVHIFDRKNVKSIDIIK